VSVDVFLLVCPLTLTSLSSPTHYLGFLENILDTNKSESLVGDSRTIADLRLYQLAVWIDDAGILDGMPFSTLDAYPNVKEHMDRFKKISEIMEFCAKHSPPCSDFDYAPTKK